MIGVDANDLATQTMQPVAGFSYDANGNRGRLAYYTSGSGSDPNYYINYAYNADNLLTHIDTAGGSAFSYEASDSGDIDGLGRLKYASESIAKPEFGTMSHAYEYQYDMLSELVSSKATNIDAYEYVREQFAYNLDGNVNSHGGCYTKLSGQNETYTSDTYAYVTNGDIMSGATGNNNPFTLTNDNNGNITKLPTTSANDTVSWNYDNKLKSAQKGTASIAVKYDPMGNRIWRQSTVNGVTTGRKYIVDISGELPVILCEIDDPNSYSFGSLKTTYVYADGQILSQRIHSEEDPNYFTPYYYVHDRLGSIRLMIDDTGTAMNSYCYKPYGSFYEGEVVEAVANPWAFTGQYYDAEIAQYYLRARQYDPQMMRFTSRDPVLGKQTEPLTLHKYLYCLNNAANRTDPSGKFSTNLASAVVTGYSLYGQGLSLAAYAVDSGDDRFFDLALATFKFIPTALVLAAINPMGLRGNAAVYVGVGTAETVSSKAGLGWIQSLATDQLAGAAYYYYMGKYEEKLGVTSDDMWDFSAWMGIWL
jgi:RHS repeat-associated protein